MFVPQCDISPAGRSLPTERWHLYDIKGQFQLPKYGLCRRYKIYDAPLCTSARFLSENSNTTVRLRKTTHSSFLLINTIALVLFYFFSVYRTQFSPLICGVLYHEQWRHQPQSWYVKKHNVPCKSPDFRISVATKKHRVELPREISVVRRGVFLRI